MSSNNNMNWTETGSYLCGTFKKPRKSKQIAAFDLDGNIIKTKSGAIFAENKDDWQFFSKNVKKKIQSLKKHRIIIITNQKRKSIIADSTDWKAKVEAVCTELNVSCEVFAAIGDDWFRKPRIGFFEEFIKYEKEGSFYCGDAAGRVNRTINGQYKSKDFSDSDLKLAKNLDIDFYTPEQYFDEIDDPPAEPKYGVDFKKISKKAPLKFKPATKQEMIICVGYPGSGKSSYATNNIATQNYVRINQDTLKTPAKCLKECENMLKVGKSVVIDNTSATSKSRDKYLELAKKYKTKTRALIFNILLDVAYHNTSVRNSKTRNEIKLIPKVAHFTFRKYYEEPTTEEGFEVIETIPFTLQLKDEEDKKLYHMYYE